MSNLVMHHIISVTLTGSRYWKDPKDSGHKGVTAYTWTWMQRVQCVWIVSKFYSVNTIPTRATEW